jgi:hypothetical protein
LLVRASRIIIVPRLSLFIPREGPVSAHTDHVKHLNHVAYLARQYDIMVRHIIYHYQHLIHLRHKRVLARRH